MIISKRAEALLNTPQNGIIFNDSFNEEFKWKITTDKKLTLSFESINDPIQVLLMESICFLLNQKELRNLFSLSFREVENYLRDSNETPAFQTIDQKGIEEKYERLLSQLTSFLLNFLHDSSKSEATLVGQNQFWMRKLDIFEGIDFVFKKKEKLYFYNKRSDSIVSFNISE